MIYFGSFVGSDNPDSGISHNRIIPSSHAIISNNNRYH